MERLTGSDALMWHMEADDTPMHTLKVVILDPARRGRPVTLAELRAAVEAHIGLLPRATQRVVAAPGFGGRPFWVDDPDIDLDAHLDERTLPAPGGQAQLDAVYTDLSTATLDVERPPWALTLVHGLAGGRQAVVVRVHHALTDGLGALNAFLALTTDQPGRTVEPAPAPVAAPIDRKALGRAARRGLWPWLVALVALVRRGRRTRQIAKEFRAEHPDVPPFFGARRNFCNVRSGTARVCASSSLPLDDFKRIGRATGATVNGVLHGAIAGALRVELLERGEATDERAVAAFGIAVDTSSTRTWGNEITPTAVALHTDEPDPVERLVRTAKSCIDGVALRRATGVDMAGRWAEYGPRFAPAVRARIANISPRVVNHITTANVAGPRTSRWFGDIEVVDWFSFAVAVAPANLNLTVYSYAGRMNMGLVATPEALPDPARFLRRIEEALTELTDAVERLEAADEDLLDEPAVA